MRIKASYYRQFDADLARDVPAEGYGGWQEAEIACPIERTALVVMHAWDTGTPQQFPGWHRAVEYMPRAQAILASVFPPLLTAARKAGLSVLHVVGGGDYYRSLPGYQRVEQLAGPPKTGPDHIDADESLRSLRAFRARNVFVGEHNEEDVRRGFATLDFAPEARPAEGEPIAENADQLLAVCRHLGVNHLVYVGFAINWCLLLSPGGMADMSARGLMCSTIRQATTAVENRETARTEMCKEVALWRVALAFGFVFELDDFIDALEQQL